MALSDLACKNLKPAAKAYKKADEKSLYLLVKPNGSKLWRMDYVFEKKRKTLAFGAYPEIKLVEAREKRDAARKVLADGSDPGVDDAAIKAVVSFEKRFEAVADRWYDTFKHTWTEDRQALVRRRLDKDVLPFLSGRDVSQIDPPAVLAVVRRIESRGAIEVSKRIKGHISNIFAFAVAEGLAVYNPCADINKALKPSPKVKHRAKLRAEQLPEFFERLSQYPGGDTVQIGIEAVLRTAVRTGEIRFARPREFDFAKMQWTIPPERMKMRREHIVPLTPQSATLFKRAIEVAGGSEWVFPQDGGHKPMSENAMLYGLYSLGYFGIATIHGLRGTFSTVLNDSGRFRKDWIEKQLAHEEEDEVRGAYNAAEYLDHRVAMMKWWNDYLDRQRAAGGESIDDLLTG